MSDQKNVRRELLRDSNFRWVLGGGIVSMLGDQFTLIALPWLVLKLAGDALTLGLVLTLMGVPRALLILFGGAVVDRYSPKRVLMLSKHANTLLLALLAALVISGHATLPLVVLLALALGVATAFGIPASMSMLPHTVSERQLPAANAIMMGMRQLTMLSGPLLAGLLLAFGGDGSAGLGLGLALAFDAFSFAFSAWTLSKVRTREVPRAPAATPILGAVGSGLAVVWRDVTLRSAFIYWGVCNCVVGGLLQVALPVIADTRLHGAGSLGLILGAFSGGKLAGMALTGIAGRLRLGNLGTTLLTADVLVAALLLPMGQVQALWQPVLIFVVLGVMGGFMEVAVITWVQQRMPREMMGRTMSIFMFIIMGLAPLAAGVVGWVLHYTSLPVLFAGAAATMAIAAALAWTFTPIRTMADVAPGKQA